MRWRRGSLSLGIAAALVAALAVGPRPAAADEGGSGHYAPGFF